MRDAVPINGRRPMRQGGTKSTSSTCDTTGCPHHLSINHPRRLCPSALHATPTPVPICGSGESGKALPVSRLSSHALLQTAFSICKPPSDFYFIPPPHAVHCVTSSPASHFHITLFSSRSRYPAAALSPIRRLTFTFPYSTASPGRT